MEKEAHQALRWASLAALHDLNAITILIAPYQNWYQNVNPYDGPSSIHMSSHTSKLTISPTKIQQSNKNSELNLEHKLCHPYTWHTL